MKNFFLFFIIINIFLFTASFKVQAQLNFSFPGLNCGLAEDTTKNKCCIYDNPFEISYPDMGPLNPLVKVLNFFIVKTQTQLIEPIINTSTEIFKNNLSPCYTGIMSTNTSDPDCKCISPINQKPDAYLYALNDFVKNKKNLKID